MVVTRSMSGTTKKADTKIAVNYKVETTAERASRQTRMKERKETFLKQFREKYPDIKIVLEDIIKKVNREKSGTTAERASKKTTVERALLMKQTSMTETALRDRACSLFIIDTFLKQFRGKYPDINIKKAKAPYVAEVEKSLAAEVSHAEDYKKGIIVLYRAGLGLSSKKVHVKILLKQQHFAETIIMSLAGLCYGKLEAAILTFVIPTFLLGHLTGLMDEGTELSLLGLWMALFVVFAGRKFTQPIKDDIGDKSVFMFYSLPEEEKRALLTKLQQQNFKDNFEA